jgi:hypothetical protein
MRGGGAVFILMQHLGMIAHRDLIGDSAVIGDSRWGGSWGIQADFLARTRCCVVSIRIADLQVTPRFSSQCCCTEGKLEKYAI